MMLIPFRLSGHTERGPFVVFVILEKDNLERMQKGDPCDLQFAQYRALMPTEYAIDQLDLVIAYEEDIDKILKFKDDTVGLLTWLERGRKHQPGDVTPPIHL